MLPNTVGIVLNSQGDFIQAPRACGDFSALYTPSGDLQTLLVRQRTSPKSFYAY